MSDRKLQVEAERRKRNQRLVDAVKAGEHIPALVSQELRHFPPRPVIKKDRRELERIFGDDLHSGSKTGNDA